MTVYEAGAIGYDVTTLARELRDHPPEKEIEVIEYTAWSCPHGLARWSTGCDCTSGDTRWKGALRRAFDNLANRLDEAYTDFARSLGLDPWPVREMYYRVRLGQLTEGQLLRDMQLTWLNPKQSSALMTFLLSQFFRQRMYVSSTFFFEDLDRSEPRYAVGNAVRALLLVTQVTGTDFSAAFRRDLTQAISNKSGKNGGQILDEVMAWARESGAV